jgi:type II secretory pathway component PulL
VRAGAAPSAPNLAIAMPTRAPAAGGATFLRAGIAAAAALLVFAVAPWVEVFRLDASTASLRREAEAIARTALPQGTRIVNPVAQLREAAFPMQRLESQINLTAGLYEGLARSPGVELGRIQADEEGAILADLTTSDAKLLQPLRDHLAAEGVSLEEVPGAGAPNRLVFSITLRGQP